MSALEDIFTIDTDYANGLFVNINKNILKEAGEELTALRARIKELEKVVDEARYVIKKSEFTIWVEGRLLHICKFCGKHELQAHKDDCELWMWLVANPKEE
jgi:hypothetical protein